MSAERRMAKTDSADAIFWAIVVFIAWLMLRGCAMAWGARG